MGEINTSRAEQEALDAIDIEAFGNIVDKAVREGRSTEVRQALYRCGPYVSSHLYQFEQAIDAHSKAKAAWKREQTASDLYRAGSDLRYAVEGMKRRVETERRQGELFFVEDAILTPRFFSKDLSVNVRYRWRQAVDEDWEYGAITFSHEVDLSPDYTLPAPKRKPSAAQRQREVQERLFRTWDHLKLLALMSVRDFFEAGRDGADIPEAFRAKADRHGHGLNNFSADFWERR
jgi:hypothetical protein